MADFECKRCGQCCIAVGRTFWVHGDFADYPELKRLSDAVTEFDDCLPCAMLQMKDGVASCKIQELYGYDAKPDVCREYPELPGNCWEHKQELKGRRICLQETG